jgi:uncharacterized protein (TIGR00369 family)
MIETTRPYGVLMGFSQERGADGRLTLIMDFDENKTGRPGYLHGGAIAGLLESAGFAALADAMGEDLAATPAPRLKPINATVTYMRAGLKRRTYARAMIERLGRTVANVEVTAWQDDPAKPIAMAQMNILIDRS